MEQKYRIEKITMGMLAENCYILEDIASGALAVIDPGIFNDALKAQLPAPERVRYILLTHRHFDHVTGAAALREYTGAKVVIHPEDECGLEVNTADLLVTEGDELTLGSLHIRVLHTPGHSRGGVCYLTEDLLFSGDTLFFEQIGRLDMESGNYEDMIASLEKLMSLDSDYTVLPGHGEPTTLEHERLHNPYVGKKTYDDFLI